MRTDCKVSVDYRLTNLTKRIKQINQLANKRQNLKAELARVEKEAEDYIKEVSEILRYNGIHGSYQRLEHYTEQVNND